MEPLLCQKGLFMLEEEAHYLNCGAYSPLLMSSREAGHRAIDVKCNPQKITPASHFDGIKELRCCIAELLDARDPDRIAVFPSVSYGMAIVAANLHRVANISHKSNIVVLQDEFPNDTYAFCRVAEELSLSISPIPQPQDFDLMGDLWNLQLLEGITVATAAVIVPNVHWMFGVVFDLEAIANKCRDCGSLLIVDASQSVGALPLDVGRIQPDALICAGYKWVFGPYSLSFGYFGEFFDGGVPVEESWMNRVDSHQFSSLTNLKTEYRPKAQRYNMGESSDFIHAAILQDALKQLLRWRVAKVQDYARALSGELVAGLADLAKKGGERACCRVLPESYRSPHLIAVLLPAVWAGDALHVVNALKAKNVFVSLRGSVLRVSVGVFNTSDDVNALLTELSRLLLPCDENTV